MKMLRRTFLAALCTALAGPALLAGEVFVEDGVAIRGTDPVGYFTEGRPVPGDPAITAEWGGATWRFASAANRDRFLADPEAVAPQFGGYCAWAVANGYTAETDPEAWKIVGGKLYLNYSPEVQADWETDIPGNIAKAEKNWPGLR
jgi:hypothetical protein